MQDSITITKTSSTSDFYTWYDSSLAKLYIPTGLKDDSLNPEQKTNLQIAFAKELYNWIKKTLPRYSLDKGFELTNAALHSQRQCFLQAIILTSILHKNNIDAAIAMVNLNDNGSETNNGHAIVILKLPNGNDIILDGSAVTPFMNHLGIFVNTPDGYLYVKPVYMMGSNQISYYSSTADSQIIPTSSIIIFDLNFLRSQIYYYRGEQAKNGSISEKPNKKGLSNSLIYLKIAYQYCPNNPLVLYILSKTYDLLDDNENASAWKTKAKNKYSSYGWVPVQLK